MADPGPRDFLVPDLGEGLEEATVVEWLVAVGEPIALNQPLCIVETAKAEVEVPSPYAGTVVVLGGEPGDTLAVGALLTRIDTSSGVGGPPAQPDAPAPADEAASRPEPTLVGYGHDDAIDRSRRSRHGATRPAPAAATSGAVSPSARPLAKPPVRRLARTLGIDLGDVAPGSGPAGIVTRSDVHRAAASLPPEAVPGTPAARSAIPVQGVRARIAEHLTRSRARIPDATCGVTADCTRLLEVRAALNDHAARHGRDAVVTPFSLLCRLVVQSLQANPVLNASFDEDVPEIRLHDAVHLGIGTATDRGLVVTVVRDADRLSVHALSAEMARLAEGARSGTLPPTDLMGSTFTVSNLGALGLDQGIPIINHPEAAIIGVGSIRRRPHVVDGEVVARSTASITLAFDHRVCDGAEAGRFLVDLRELVEAPELALLDS